MVAKINVGSSLYGALSYNGQKINEGEGKLLATHKIFDKGDGKLDIAQAMSDFQRCMPSQIRSERPVAHISLNPHPDDKLDDVQLSAIAQKYLEKLGYGNQPYVIFKHEDIARHHLHIVTLNVDEEGKKLNDSFLKRRSKRITDELETKYDLHPASKKRDTLNEAIKVVNPETGSVKRQIANVLKATASYRFQTMGEYRALLSLYRISVEEVRGEVKEQEYHGLVYSCIDKNGEKLGNPFKSSLFGKDFGYDELLKRMKKSKADIQQHKLGGSTRQKINAVLKQTHRKDRFALLLQQKGIDVVLRETDTSRIYGATFIDHHTGCVLNGSRLGKDFSANALEEHFANAHIEMPISENERLGLLDTDAMQEQGLNEGVENGFDGDSFGLGLGLFETHGTDPEEERFRRLMQRKKKKHPRRRL